VHENGDAMMGPMNRLVAVLILLVAATLETGGDALVRPV
jgi:hypothetical protein